MHRVRDVLVLCYHAVSDGWPSVLAVTPERLRAHVTLLLRRGYVATTFTEAVLNPPARRTVAVTFDDAYSSVVERGLPVLADVGAPASVFVPTSFTGTQVPMAWPGIDEWLGGAFESELMPASWEGLGLLAREGWEIGSHTHTHPRLTRLGDERLRIELERSRRELQARLGAPCRSLAYPYGDHDDRVVRAASAAGYEAAGTLPSRLHRPAPLRYPRVGIYPVDHGLRYRLKVSRTARRLRTSAAWEHLRPSREPPAASRDHR